MDFSFSFFISAVVLILEQQGHTESSSVPQSDPSRNPAVNASPQTHRREKRCSCENLRDKECIYFCHIGIVWVDTPSQVIPYGVGSPQTRLRRNVKRCLCANKRDTKCLTFCSARDPQREEAHVPDKRFHLRNFKEHKSRFLLNMRRHNPIQDT